jgi:hypothetical protein
MPVPDPDKALFAEVPAATSGPGNEMRMPRYAGGPRIARAPYLALQVRVSRAQPVRRRCERVSLILYTVKQSKNVHVD